MSAPEVGEMTRRRSRLHPVTHVLVTCRSALSSTCVRGCCPSAPPMQYMRSFRTNTGKIASRCAFAGTACWTR